MNEAYQINPNAELGNLIDDLSQRLGQAKSMSFVLVNDDGRMTDFECWSDEIKSDYIWLLQRTLDECEKLFKAICDYPEYDPRGKRGGASGQTKGDYGKDGESLTGV